MKISQEFSCFWQSPQLLCKNEPKLEFILNLYRHWTGAMGILEDHSDKVTFFFLIQQRHVLLM